MFSCSFLHYDPGNNAFKAAMNKQEYGSLSVALKGSHFFFLFDFTAAGVVPCGGRKTSPRTSTIVQFIIYFGPLRSAIIF